MNARVKRVAAAQDAVDRDDGPVVVGVVKRPIWENGKVTGFIRRIIVAPRHEHLPHQPDAAAARNEINEGIASERSKTD